MLSSLSRLVISGGSLARGSIFVQGSLLGVAAASSHAWLHSSSACQREVEGPAVPKSSGSTVVLMTGGIESAALLSYWSHWSHGHTLHPLFVKLGRSGEVQELKAAQRLCQHLGLELSVLNAEMLGHELRLIQEKGLLKRFIPHRNFLLTALAASYSQGVKDGPASHIALCINQDDLNTYSTSSSAFIKHMDALLETLDPPLQLLAPLARLTHWQVIKLGEGANTPWQHTYVCQAAREKHCGECPRCVERKEAFDRAGVQEPWGLYEI